MKQRMEANCVIEGEIFVVGVDVDHADEKFAKLHLPLMLSWALDSFCIKPSIHTRGPFPVPDPSEGAE